MAYAAPKETEGNGLLAFVRMVLFSVHGEFKVEREAKYGGTIVYKTYEEVFNAYANGDLYPLDLKHAVAAAINRLLAPIRKKFKGNPKLQELIRLAYPEKGLPPVSSASTVAALATETKAARAAASGGGAAVAEVKSAAPKQQQQQQQPKKGGAAPSATKKPAMPATLPEDIRRV